MSNLRYSELKHDGQIYTEQWKIDEILIDKIATINGSSKEDANGYLLKGDTALRTWKIICAALLCCALLVGCGKENTAQNDAKVASAKAATAEKQVEMVVPKGIPVLMYHMIGDTGTLGSQFRFIKIFNIVGFSIEQVINIETDI